MEFTLQATFNASPEQVYTAWLSSEGHTQMTGGIAVITDQVGGRFTAWDGYIEGKNLALAPHRRILQSWRTSQFEEHEPDSRLEILLKSIDGKTELKLIHSGLPGSGEQYREGWDEHYFQPMQDYFSR